MRFHLDIARAFEFGSQVLRLSEKLAQLPDESDALANQSPQVLAALPPDLRARALAAPRRLTLPELIQGWVHYYANVNQLNPEGDYDLDYPPMRLYVQTLSITQTFTRLKRTS